MQDKLLSYFNGDDLASSVWVGKYAQEGEETPDDMHKRLAKEFARVEQLYVLNELPNDKGVEDLSEYGKIRKDLTEENIYELFKDFKYIIPQGSIMSQLGAKSIGSLSNCFVIGTPEDSYGGIFQKDQEMAQLMKRRGGVGLDISTLRPKDTLVSNAAKTTTGAISFMHRFSNTTREVAQNGRRGALMLSIDINHPDVMNFIKIKRDGTSITGANISIKINNEFMKAVENDKDYLLRFPCNVYDNNDKSLQLLPTLDYNVLEKIPESQSNGVAYIKKIKAREYWDEIIKSAHGYAEPGIIFVDNHHNYSPDGVYPQFKGVTTNPCGEIFMQPYDACRLMALNLYSFVSKPFTKDAEFDIKKFYEVNYEAMRLSDALIDLELEHIDRILEKISNDSQSSAIKYTERKLWLNIKETAEASRRTGLGFTALGDCLAALGYKYDSEEALLFTEQFMHVKMESELDCTIDLAVLRGTFDGWNNNLEYHEVSNDFYKFIRKQFPEQYERMQEWGRRNVSISTVAPTGSVSLLTQTTSGIEPLFMPFYMRRKKVNGNERVDFVDEIGDKWQEFPVLHEKFKDWYLYNLKVQKERIEKEEPDRDISWTPVEELTKEQLQKSFELSPWYGSTANDIDWIKRVEIQSTIQKYITHSISSTINLPNNVSEEEVSKIYLESWKQGLKGITVYRDGSRSGVLVSSTENKGRNEFNYVDAPKRPKELKCKIHTTNANGKKYNVIIGLLNDKPYEVFVTEYFTHEQELILKKINKGRYDLIKDGQTYSESITSEMTDEQAAITRLVSVSLRHGADIKFIVEQINKCDGDLFSFTKGLVRVLKKYIPDGTKSTVKCNDCGSENVIFEEGCSSCKDCGSSRCG